MSRIKGLIFDLDGTIIDNRDSYMELMLSRVGDELGMELTLRHAQELWYSVDAMSRDDVIARWGVDPDRFWTIFNKYESLEEKRLSTYLHDDARSVSTLNMPKGIVTHTSMEHTIRLLEQVGMRECFDPIISCTEDTGYKPSPLPIIYCLIEMRLHPDEVLFIGDTASDMMAAKDAGVKSVYVNRSGRPVVFPADFEISSLTQLPAIMDGCGETHENVICRPEAPGTGPADRSTRRP
jgi:phosphoglycolate phosphatase